MLREIYTRDTEDPKYDASMIEYRDAAESIVQQVKMILGTSRTDVLGEPGMGVGIEDLIFQRSYSAASIKDKISAQIRDYVYVPDGYEVSVDVGFGKQENGFDYGVIDIYINQTRVSGILVE